MKLKQWHMITIFLFLFFNAQHSEGLEKQADGVLIEIKKEKETDARWIKIQVCTESIIHVLAAPEKSFSNRPSLMVSKTIWEPVPWSLKENDSCIEISTSKIIARVHSKNGTIAFYDAKGRLLLQEKTDGGKIIAAADVMGEHTYHIQQLFNSPDDEAFYGLGGHQNSIMNYKSHDVDLWQRNMWSLSPFLFQIKTMGSSGTITRTQSSETFANFSHYPLSNCTIKIAFKETLLQNILKTFNSILFLHLVRSQGSSTNSQILTMNSRKDSKTMSQLFDGVA